MAENLNQEEVEVDHIDHFSFKRLLITVSLVVVGSALTSGVTWFFLSKLNDVTTSSSSELVTTLEKEITYLEKQYSTNCSNGVVLGTNPTYGSITGNILYPSEGIPNDVKVTAVSLSDGKTYDATVTNDGVQATYSVSVPAGKYNIYGTRAGFKDAAGVVWKAYYDQFVLCGMSTTCKDTSKIVLNVQASKTVSNVTIGDWYPTK